MAEHHREHTGVWIRFFKVDSGHDSVSYSEALDIALCYGWIDGPVRKGDELSWIHKFTPRGKRSVWSQRNKQHIERLIREGRMQAAGLAEVEAAQGDGRWDAAYASSSTFVESPEFLAALKKSKAAASFYARCRKPTAMLSTIACTQSRKPKRKLARSSTSSPCSNVARRSINHAAEEPFAWMSPINHAGRDDHNTWPSRRHCKSHLVAMVLCSELP